MIFGEVPVDEAENTILAHTVRAQSLTVKKGVKLSAADINALSQAGIETVMVARIEAGDVMENEVAQTVASRLGGPGVDVMVPVAGRCNLHAQVGGVVTINAAIIDALNGSGDGVVTSTVAPFEVVEPGRALATIKVIPYAIPKARLKALTALTGQEAAIAVHTFRPRRVGLVLTRVAGNQEKLLDKAHAVISARLETYGSRVVHEARIDHGAAVLADAIEAMRTAGADLILILGGASTSDRKDVVPAAIERAGGTIDLFGVPVDPGNLLVSARLGDISVLGLPGCARSPQSNGVDLILPRVLADLDVSPGVLLGMGVGGLLKDVPDRAQPRESHPPKTPAIPRGGVSALVLAGGASKRMGKTNKLLVEVDGTALVRQVAAIAFESDAAEVIVVTGHEADLVREALSVFDVRFVHNPYYQEGLSTSLRAGIGAVSEEISGAVVLLGDMPRVTAGIVNALIKQFHADQDGTICQPTFDGRPGNPVLWPREYFPEMLDIWGDSGARQLIERYADRVSKVEVGDAGIHFDIDTPDDL
ncbi:MAG: molybdopterin-binding/glycosyltransferase family 2 protein [Proteobacteria bacterium]|nr:molybdopterin-binding/glycosyltransferase family 2 protein [Pseudomonadota bacterium]